MIKQLFALIALLGTQILPAQNALHSLPYANFQKTISETEVVSQIEEIIGYLDDPNGHDGCPLGEPSVYYSRRVQSHIQLYNYFQRIGDIPKAKEQFLLFEANFKRLLCWQCMEGAAEGFTCSSAHGGFPSGVNNDLQANPLSTAVGLQALVEARNLYEVLGEDLIPIACAELEYRIHRAKNALYSYPEINNQYLNLTAFAFMAASTFHQRYNDPESLQFLTEKADQLINKNYPLRPNAVPSPIPPVTWNYAGPWTYSWSEGYQADGSWKDFGRDNPSPLPGRIYGPCERWHDSEFAYHSLMTQGMAVLFGELAPGALRDSSKNRLFGSINHVIDYNGQMTFLELPFNPTIVANGYQNTRLTPGGRISRYHRETDVVCRLDPGAANYAQTLQRKEVGVTFLRSLLFSRLALSASPAELQTLDSLISGVTFGILATDGSRPAFAFEQLYDLSLYLNRDHLQPSPTGGSQPLEIHNNKLVAAFENDTVSSFQGALTSEILNSEYPFYSGSQKVQHAIGGDFNGDGTDELILSFVEGRTIYRFEENCSGELVSHERFYDGFVYDINGVLIANNGVLSQGLEAGDFDGDGKDELIVAFADGRIVRYYENGFGTLVADPLPLYDGNELASGMSAGNFDGDAPDELVIVTKGDSLRRFFFEPGGTLSPLYLTQKVEGMKAINIRHGSTDELVIASGNLVYLYQNLSSGLNLLGLPLNFNATAPQLIVGDYNGDGYDELIVAMDDKTLTRCLFDPMLQTLTAEPSFYAGNQWTRRMQSLDFDRDGKDELAVAFSGGNIYRCIDQGGSMSLNGVIYQGLPNSTRAMTALNKFRRADCEPGACGISAAAKAFATEETTETSHSSMDFGSVAVYPNPVSNELWVRGADAIAQYSLYNGTGQVIRSGQLESRGRIDFSGVPVGMYFLIIDQKVFKLLKTDQED